MTTQSRLTDHEQSDLMDELIVDVLDEIERIAAPLSCWPRLAPALSAARSGTIAIEPRPNYFYLLGACHSVAADIDPDVWECLDAALDRLLSRKWAVPAYRRLRRRGNGRRGSTKKRARTDSHVRLT